MTRTLGLTLCWLVMAVFVTGCLNLNNDNQQTTSALSTLGVFQGAPAGPDLNLFLDGQPLNNQAFTYGFVIDYFIVNSGKRSLKFTSFTDGTILIDTAMNLVQNGAYSIFVVNSASTIKLLSVQNTGVLLSANDIMLRMVHLSPDSPAVNVTLAGQTTPLFTGQSFKVASPFHEIEAKDYTVEIRAASDNHIILTAPFSPKPNTYYSILLLGFTTPPANNTNTLLVKVIAI